MIVSVSLAYPINSGAANIRSLKNEQDIASRPQTAIIRCHGRHVRRPRETVVELGMPEDMSLRTVLYATARLNLNKSRL